jgi:hypothetical protein
MPGCVSFAYPGQRHELTSKLAGWAACCHDNCIGYGVALPVDGGVMAGGSRRSAFSRSAAEDR